MLEFSIGLSAIQAAQRAMEVTGNNVANASTPGYHRQVVKLAAQAPMELNGQSYGRGVEVADVQRTINTQLEAAITTQTTQNGYVDTKLTSMNQIQSMIPTDASSIANELSSVFNDLQQASSQLGNPASRQTVVTQAQSLATQFNSLSANMDQMRTGMDSSIASSVSSINSMLTQIAGLNTQIARAVDQGVSPNDLLDTRDQLVNNVAQQMPIEIQQGQQQTVTILRSGAPLVIAGNAQQLQYGLDKQDRMQVSVAGATTPLIIDSGSLGALLDARNNQLTDFRQRLDDLAQSVSQAFDTIQSTGVGLAGGFSQMTSQRPVTRSDAMLNAAGLAFPPTAGSVFIGVTNTTTGQRTMAEVHIDPANQSLKDVATAIGTSNPNIQAFVNDQAGTVSLYANPGYKFDFSGGVDATPVTSFSAGTTVTATTGGVPSDPSNNTYTYTFLSSGTVGVTAGLQARVTDQNGNVMGTVNVGQGYEAGQPTAATNGVTMTLSAGDVTAGDSLSTRAVGDPDSAGVLTALGLNTFFTGNDASTIQVNSQLVGNPDLLATSRSGQAGDTTNLQRFVSLQDGQLMGDGTLTFTKFFNNMVSDVGSQVSSLTQQSSTNQVLTTRLSDQQASVSGVDMNEEMMQVIKYQQLFQSGAKFISAVNEMYQQLFQSL
ncbi:MAG TPA: flagellar hook-associated protein FlgK [Schlesneria sp.]|jgi:flagellar hook-associated protein FlgK